MPQSHLHTDAPHLVAEQILLNPISDSKASQASFILRSMKPIMTVGVFGAGIFAGALIQRHAAPNLRAPTQQPSTLEAIAPRLTLQEISTATLIRETLIRMANTLIQIASSSTTPLQKIALIIYKQLQAMMIMPRNAHDAAEQPSVVNGPAPKKDVFSHPLDIDNTESLRHHVDTEWLSQTNIVLNEPLTGLQVDNKGILCPAQNGATFEPWAASDLPQGQPKMIAFLPAKHEHHLNLKSLGEAIDHAKFPKGKFYSCTIVNLSELPGGGMLSGLNSLASGVRGLLTRNHTSPIETMAVNTIIRSVKDHPDIAVILDKHGSALEYLGLERNTTYTLVLDEHNRVITGLKGAPSEQQQHLLIHWCKERVQQG